MRFDHGRQAQPVNVANRSSQITIGHVVAANELGTPRIGLPQEGHDGDRDRAHLFGGNECLNR
jgi:hypothetical protein